MKNKKDKIVRGCHSIVVCCEFRLRNVQSAYNGFLFSILRQSLSLSLCHCMFIIFFPALTCTILFLFE